MKEFSLCLILSILFLYLNLTPVARQVRGVVSTFTSPVSFVFLNSYTTISNVLGLFTKLTELQRENVELKKSLTEVQGNLVSLLEQLKNQKLVQSHVDLLGGDSKLVKANIVGKKQVSDENYFIINKGLESEISEGDNVLYNGYLVGLVDSVSTSRSVVRTVLREKVAVEDSSTGSTGIYYCELTSCVMDNILTSDLVNEGDLIITSGIGGRFVRGILIGEVFRIESLPEEAFKKAYVRNIIDLERVSSVIVVKNVQ